MCVLRYLLSAHSLVQLGYSHFHFLLCMSMCAFKSEFLMKLLSQFFAVKLLIQMFHTMRIKFTFEVEALFTVFAFELSVKMCVRMSYQQVWGVVDSIAYITRDQRVVFYVMLIQVMN